MRRLLIFILLISIITVGAVPLAHASDAATADSRNAEEAQDILGAADVSIYGSENATAIQYLKALFAVFGQNSDDDESVMEYAANIGLTVPDGDLTYDYALDSAFKLLGYDAYMSLTGKTRDIVASQQKISKNIDAANSDVLTKDAAAVILANIMQAKYFDIDLSEAGQYTFSEKTVLEQYLGLEISYENIVDADRHDRIITVERNGATKTFRTSSNVDFDRVALGETKVYLDGNIICYVECDKLSDVFYDYIYSVNEDYSDVALYADQIKKLEFYNIDGTYKMSKDAVIYYNDKLAGAERINVLDCFARVGVDDNKIVSIDIYDVQEGGLVKSSSLTSISYVQGNVYSNIMGDLSTVDNITVIIDGVRRNGIISLEKNMVFDFWIDDAEENMLVVASSRSANGEVQGISDKEINIAGTNYKVSKNVFTYDAVTKRYETGVKYSEYADIYIDDRCEVRYIREDTSTASLKTMYGVVKGAQSTGFDSRNRKLLIIPVDGSGAGNGETEYTVVKKLPSDSLTFEYAKSVASDYNGKGFLKFSLNSKNEIYKIETVEYFTNTSIMNGSVSHSDTDNHFLGYWLGDAKMIILYESKDGFSVATTNWKTFRGNYFKERTSDVYMTVDYDPILDPIPRFCLVSGATDKIWYDYKTTGFVSKLVNRSDDCYMTFGDNSYSVTDKFIKENNIKEFSYLVTVQHPYAKDRFEINNVVDLSCDISLWPERLTEAFGEYDNSNPVRGALYPGKVILKGEEYIQFEVNGEPTNVFGFGTGVGVFNITDGKKRTVESAPLGLTSPDWNQQNQGLRNIRVGDNVYFTYEDNRVTKIYYCSTGSVYKGR